jgi:hypothetical protein
MPETCSTEEQESRHNRCLPSSSSSSLSPALEDRNLTFIGQLVAMHDTRVWVASFDTWGNTFEKNGFSFAVIQGICPCG